MNYGIGVRTPRGTGTSGWVQQSKAYIKQSVIDQHKTSTRNKTKIYDEEERKPKGKVVSTAVLEHERKVRIENEVVDWGFEQGFYDPGCTISKEEIIKLTNEKRKEITRKHEKENLEREEALQDGTHEMAKEKEEENAMMKKILQVNDSYRDGDAFNREYQEKRRTERIQMRYQAEREKELKRIEEEERERMRKEEELKKARKEKREAERKQRKIDKERRKQKKMLKKVGLSSKDIETVFSSADPDTAFATIMNTVAGVKKEVEEKDTKKSEDKHKHHHHHHHHHDEKEDKEKTKDKKSDEKFDTSLVKKEKMSDSDDDDTNKKIIKKEKDRSDSKHKHHHKSTSTDSKSGSSISESESYSSDDEKEEKQKIERSKKTSHKRSRSASSSSEESDYDHSPKKKKRSH